MKNYVITKYTLELTFRQARRTFFGCDDSKKAEMLKSMLFTSFDTVQGDLKSREQAIAYQGSFSADYVKTYAGSVIEFEAVVAEEWGCDVAGDLVSISDMFYSEDSFNAMVEKLNTILY